MRTTKIAVESYGCTMNKGEARRAASNLEDLGYDIIFGDGRSSSSRADTVLLFTCDVISTTERKMWKRMEELSSSGKEIIVAGCLVHVKGEEILERFPHAKLMDSMGVERLSRSIPETFQRSHSGIKDVEKGSIDRLDHIVMLSSGCFGSCTYCITRRARGGHVSNSPESVIGAVERGRQKGRREILLTSQDTGAYGRDLDPPVGLGKLLKTLTSQFSDGLRFRVGMMNPNHLMEEIDAVLDGYDNSSIFKFFHVPVQSGSDMVLSRMRRRYSADDLPELFDSVRKRFPDCVISTDIITGFPGERDEDHLDSMELIRTIRPDILNITRFSRREGTPAADMQDQVPGFVSKARSREFSSLHGDMLKEQLAGRIGLHRDCLITEVGKPGTMMARDENYMPIVIEGDRELLGSFQDIETHGFGPTYLMGRSIER